MENQYFSIFTIGHSSHSWPEFARLLSNHQIDKLIDVRSRPRSRFAHFNQGELSRRLSNAGIEYQFRGDTLGGRPASGDADYETMALRPAFASAVAGLVCEAVDGNVVLMCSEHDPIECHRCLLIGRALGNYREVSVLHILRDASVERQSETEDRLLRLTRQTETDLFGSREDRLMVAYRMQNMRLVGLGKRSAGTVSRGAR